MTGMVQEDRLVKGAAEGAGRTVGGRWWNDARSRKSGRRTLPSAEVRVREDVRSGRVIVRVV